MNRSPFKTDSTDVSQVYRRIAERVLWVSGIFLLLVAILMAANFRVARRSDPVEAAAYQGLLERIEREGENDGLRELARDLDLMSRKAFFANIAFNRTGGNLLLIGALVFLLAFQVRALLGRRLPEAKRYIAGEGDSKERKVQQWATAGMVVLVGSLGLILSLRAPTMIRHETANPVSSMSGAQTSDSVIAEEVEQPEVADEIPIEAAGENSEPVKTVDKLPPPTREALQRNWPGFRGAFGNAAVAQNDYPLSWDGSSGKGIVWKAKIPKEGFSSPVVWGERVFITGGDDESREIYCFDAASGKLLWQRSTKGLKGLAEKAPRVTRDTGHAAATGVCDGRYFVAIFSTGDLVCVDMDGEVVWTRGLGVPANRYGHSSSLLADGERLFVQFDHEESAAIYGLSIHSGEILWRTKRDVGPGWSSPILVQNEGRKELILTGAPWVDAYDPATGRHLWAVDCLSGEVAPSPAFAHGLVFATNEYASINAININTREIVWRHDEELPDVSSLLVTGDCLIVPTGWGMVTCYRAQTGEVLWKNEFDAGFYASPIRMGQRIYLMDRNGVMKVFKAGSNFELLASSALGEPVVSTPAFSGGRIFIRSSKHLYCIGNKQ